MSTIAVLGIIALVIINLLISALNGFAAGAEWRMARAPGAPFLYRWTIYGAYAMSVIGFSQITLAILLVIAKAMFGSSMPSTIANLAIDMWIILVALPLLGFGVLMTAVSVIEFVRKPSMAGGIAAAWNVSAMAHNASTMTEVLPGAVDTVMKAAGAVATPDSSDGADESALAIISGRLAVGLAILIVGLALAGSIAVTHVFFRWGRDSMQRSLVH